MKNLIKNWLFGNELKQIEEQTAKIEEQTAKIEELVQENTEIKAKKTDKEIATELNQPWVNVAAVDFDPADPGNGSFELDWNSVFVLHLTKQGFIGENDAAIVDQWFSRVCKNIALETYEQYMSDPTNRASIERRNLGGGKSEYS